MQWAAFGKFYTNSHVWEVTASRWFVWAKVPGNWSRRSSGPLSSSLGRPFNNKGWHLNSSWLLHKCKISSCDPECKDETVILVFFICLWTFPLIFLFVLWLSVVVFLLCCCSYSNALNIVSTRYLTVHVQGNANVKCFTLMHVVAVAEDGLVQWYLTMAGGMEHETHVLCTLHAFLAILWWIFGRHWVKKLDHLF